MIRVTDSMRRRCVGGRTIALVVTVDNVSGRIVIVRLVHLAACIVPVKRSTVLDNERAVVRKRARGLSLIRWYV